ncbi:MAG: ECF transporter S component [Halanaerobiales bacterium]
MEKENQNIKMRLRNLKLKEMDARTISFLALFIAFVAVATLINLRGPNLSYFNLGEIAIYTVAFTFGSGAGAVSGAVGSALADTFLGYFLPWAPVTFVVKGVEGWLVGKIADGENWKKSLVAVLVGGHIMILGYGLTKVVLFSWPAALQEIGIDYGQMIIGGAVAIPLSTQLNKYFGK